MKWGGSFEGLSFAILQLLETELNFTERLRNYENGLAKISVPSFRNLPDKLSMISYQYLIDMKFWFFKL